VTIRGTVAGAPDATVVIITNAGCIARATTDDTGEGEVEWTGSSADIRFALIEVRHAARKRMRPMVALTNPVWLTDITPRTT
jgi:hypothetical protein